MSEVDQGEPIGNKYEEIIQTLPGRILPKRYRIDKLLSANPFTAIYRTIYEPEESTVTLRVFRTLVKSEDDYQYKRFKQEVKRLSALHHPNVARVLDLGLLDEGLPFIILEDLIGPTLEEILVNQNRLEADQVTLLFSQIARGVQVAHGQGILHETLKPSRIIVSEAESGEVIVRTTGFGLLSLENKLGGALKTPLAKMRFLGTAAYMSPEQCFEGAEVDGRSDIYSIGCMMYECLSGQVPFMSASADKVMQMHLEEEPTPISSLRSDLVIPRKLLAIMNKCLVKDPLQRYQFVRDLQTDLELDRDPSERDSKSQIPEALQKAEQRVKDTKEFPFKLVGTIFAAMIGLVIIFYVCSYIATMTSRLADASIWQVKLDAGKQALKEGKLADAAESLKGAMTEARKFPPPDMRLALTATELAAYDIVTGRYGQAMTNLRDALTVEQQSRADASEPAARTLELLAQAELLSGRTREAEEHADASIKISESLSGERTIRLYQSYLQKFNVLLAKNKPDEARVAFEKIKAAIGVTNVILPMELISGKRQCEALLSQAAKKYPDAEKKMQEVLGSRQEKIGLGSLATIETMVLMGKLYAAEGKYQKSTAMLQKALEVKEKAMGETSPAIAELATLIAHVCDSSKNKSQAEKYYRLAYDLAEKSWGKGTIETLPYIDAMAKLLTAKGEKQKAEVYEVEALEIRHPERVPKLGK